ncbi:hypothetical protein LPB138_06870 [Urechidicola croceus]|uniref:TVP38/TMEM64 family membrane protein n=1 Tax=Urechidicola croceus TaxID=1850246 RepID=A0A1D8P766_9FLAO|nr:hypothetical protein LPB138_06870 [Urechidicola croceus]
MIQPSIFTTDFLVEFISKFKNEMMIVYIILSLIRGFFLIPSTPFVLSGAILFPDKLLWVLLISMCGIMLSATSLYFFSDILGFSNYFKKKFPNKISHWKKKLRHPKSIYYVILWSFFPFVPTDLMCYASGLIKMPFKNLFIGVFIGEIILVSIYTYFGNSLWGLIF